MRTNKTCMLLIHASTDSKMFNSKKGDLFPFMLPLVSDPVML